MYELALFAGAGGGILGGKLLGWRTVCAVEINEFAASVLVSRQNDGLLEPFPVWDDVRTFDARPWRGRVDVISGGFPCQDISTAGKGAGINGTHSGLWKEMARIIRDIRPGLVFVENSSALTHRGLGVVLKDLAEVGYDAEWGVFGADDVGAPHTRKRLWILARYANSNSQSAIRVYDEVAGLPCMGARVSEVKSNWWQNKPSICGVDDGVAHRVDRLKALGNGQVPNVAQLAFATLSARF